MDEPTQYDIDGNVIGNLGDGNFTNTGQIASGNIFNYAAREVTFPVDNLPLPNTHFVGRAAHLQTLTAALQPAPDPQPLTITQTIAGLGGVGKSQLMLAFAHAQRAQYDVIWWLRVDEALAEDFLALGRQVGLAVDGLEQAAAVQLVRNWLSSSARRWLLLCDNADVMEPRDLRAWLPAGPQGRILITSRNRRWDTVGAVLRLDVFTEAEAWDFWRKRIELELEQELEEERTLAELARELGYLPLALEQAAAYADENELDAAGYLDLYRARRRELWARQPAPDDYHATITTTWEIGFEKARETAGAADLLNLCCFLAPDDIPLDLLVDHAASLPDDLAAVLTDPLARHDALRALERYALLTRTDGALNLHRLVQAVARDQMGEERAKVWAEGAINLLNDAWPFDSSDMKTWIQSSQLLPQLLNVADIAAQQEIITTQAASLNGKADFYLDFFGNKQQALPYSKRALAIREKALGPDPQNEALLRSTATSLNNLGGLLQAMGNLAEARPYYERALAIREKALGPNHPDTATSLNNLGALLRAMGNLAEARPYFERALAIREKALGPDHPDTARSLNNLGGLLQAMGNLAEARPYYERALAIREKALGPDHPDTASSLNNLGALLDSMGNLAEARPYYERALAIREKALGPDHPDTAQSLNNLGYLLQAMGNLAEARPYFERALAIREKALGPNHPDTATSLNNLGALLRAMGNLAEARPYYERALAIWEKALGPDHPDTALSLNNLGALLRAMGNLAEARPYYERALAIWEKALGPDHPDTALSLNNLGYLLQAMGNLAEARPYYERALAIKEAKLGTNHPSTKITRDNLAWLNRQAGTGGQSVDDLLAMLKQMLSDSSE